MKIFALKYDAPSVARVFNLGDDVQTLAASRLLPRLDGYVPRDSLHEVNEPCVVSMNGFFMGSKNWPPSPLIEPLFYAFHISPRSKDVVCSPAGLQYLKSKEPIGCRDQGTARLLQSHGIDAYYSKCVTLTFERRQEPPRNGRVFMVGGASKGLFSIVPKSIRKEAVVVNQSKVQLPDIPHETRLALARQLLEVYKTHASLVITSKIHCAMPCIAMGIPVVFLYDHGKHQDYRVDIVKDFVPINHIRDDWLHQKMINPRLSGRIDWEPKPVDMEEEKNRIRAGYLEAFKRAQTRYEARFCSAPQPEIAAQDTKQ